MKILFSILLVVLLLVYNVSSAELYRNSRLTREDKEVETIYKSNHPPSVETYIPVSVIYEEEEDIPVLSKNIKHNYSIKEETKINIDNSKQKNVKLTQETTTSKVEDVTDEPISATSKSDNKEESTNSKVVASHNIKNSNNVRPAFGLNETTDVQNPMKPEGSSPSVKTPVSKISTNRKNKELVQRRRLPETKRASVNKSQDINKPEYNNTPEQVAPTTTIGISATNIGENLGSNERSNKFTKRTQERTPVVPIVDSENYLYAFNGDYHYSYEGGDGKRAFERGALKTVDGSSGTGVVGAFSYKDKDGNDFELSYTADENGYRPVGAHLPTPPPIPIAIQRALELLATKTTPEPITERVTSLN